MLNLTHLMQLPLKNKTFEKRKETTRIVIHCSATEDKRAFTASDIQSWHLQRGFADIGYHFCVHLDGSVIKGRPLEAAGAHAVNHNHDSIGICYIGGIKHSVAYDTRNQLQKEAMVELIKTLLTTYQTITEIIGHCQLPKVAKSCPSFDARSEYKPLLPAKQATAGSAAVAGGVVAGGAVGAVKGVVGGKKGVK